MANVAVISVFWKAGTDSDDKLCIFEDGGTIERREQQRMKNTFVVKSRSLDQKHHVLEFECRACLATFWRP